MAKQLMPKLKQHISVSEMAECLDMSRARFYQLLVQGVFPQPLYCIFTQRPFYNQELQNQCIEIKETGIGVNGQIIMFYRPRKQQTISKRHSVAREHQELVEVLQAMGLDCNVRQVSEAVAQLYPNGVKEQDEGVVLRQIFRYLKSSS